MAWLEKMKHSPHYPQLRQSLEYRHCRKQLIISLVMAAFIVVPTFLLLMLGAGNAGSEVNMLFFVLFSLAIIGLCIYNAYRWLEIFLHMDDYTFFTATLTKAIVSHSRYASSVRYSLTFPNAEGTIITRETASMFHNDTDPCLQDYNGRQVLVGYNEETDRLVVIGRVAE